jgi:hypothetical protein
MKRAAPLALLLVAGVVGCGSSSVDPKTAIAELVRSSATRAGDTRVQIPRVRISKLDPSYALAEEDYLHAGGYQQTNAWFVHQRGGSWHVKWSGNQSPTCLAAPASVRKELMGVSTCYGPGGGLYRPIP